MGLKGRSCLIKKARIHSNYIKLNSKGSLITNHNSISVASFSTSYPISECQSDVAVLSYVCTYVHIYKGHGVCMYIYV